MFNYRMNTNLIFGQGASSQIGARVSKFGKKALIVTGGNSAKKSGLLDKVMEQLEKENMSFVVFDEAKPNPLITIAEKGAKTAVSNNCDIVIALGGGSVIDTAKGICARAVNTNTIADIIYSGGSVYNALALVAVPTTCGTGSEVNGIGVLTNDENKDKKAIKGPALVPKVSIVDPKLMTTMPRNVYASVAFDALCHLMEAYLSIGATQISDMMAVKGMTLMRDNLVRVYENYDDIEGWENVTLASTLGGYTLDDVSVIAPHAMDHPLGGLKNVQHGKGLAALVPAIFEELAEHSPQRMRVISNLFGGKDERDCCHAILNLLRKINLDVTLEDLGFDVDDIPWLTNNTINSQKYTLSRTPVAWEEKDVERIFYKAMDYNKNKI